ncbi:unnamed protein product [Durusdinium trenchii]|uniref:Uncharacterized protein n=1 Tax=Durusdinium trenchii TaxID=1381693 RepID=A0ABP0R9N5_9DINO
MVLIICPMLAGEGVLNGLRGAFRRIEDKLDSLNLEMKQVSVLFDDSTLGSKLALYKAPRNSERPTQDSNVFARNDFWSVHACKPSPPLPDKEETAQWVANPSTIRAILEGCLSRVSTMKGQVCCLRHFSPYDGVFQRVALGLMSELQQDVYLGLFSETTSPTLCSYVVGQMKDKLLEEWKAGQGLLGQSSQKFQASPDLSTQTKPREPVLKLCTMTDGHLTMPKDVREKWLSCPVRNPDWRQRLKNFDNVFAPVTNGEAGAPAPMVTSKTSADLDNQIPLVSETFCEPPPSLTSEEFQSKRPTLVATVTLSMGINVTCSVADDKVYITSASKAKDFLTKDGNENKAIEFRLDSQDDIALCQN